MKLDEAQLARLAEKRLAAAKVGTKTRSDNTARTIEQIDHAAKVDIGKISKRELWLMGIMLYWRNRNKNDVKKGVSFTSGDPHLVRLFIKWAKEVGQLEDSEIAFDLFLNRPKDKKDGVDYWFIETGYPQENFSHVYYYKKKLKKSSVSSGKSSSVSVANDSKGILRIRIKASSMLARQMAGWVEGVKENLK